MSRSCVWVLGNVEGCKHAEVFGKDDDSRTTLKTKDGREDGRR
jgi:hypothetical protein